MFSDARYWGAQGLSRAIGVAVPYHSLGEEMLDYFGRDEGAVIDAIVAECRERMHGVIPITSYRSMWAKQPGSDEPMCGNLDEMNWALRLGVADLKGEVCGGCALKEGCAYWAQKKPLNEAVIVVFAQANLFKTPIAWLPEFAMLIIDESPVRAALLEPDVLFADDMLEMPVSDQEEPGRHARNAVKARRRPARSAAGGEEWPDSVARLGSAQAWLRRG